MMKKGIPLVVVILVLLTPSYGLALPDSLIGEPELVDHPWPMLCHDAQHTGQSPYSTEDNLGSIKWIFTRTNMLQSSPVIAQDGTIYLGQFKYLYAINPDGTEKWRWEIDYPGGIASSPAIAPDGTIYIGSDYHDFFAVHPNGTKKWTFHTDDGVWRSAPTIAQDGTIYIGCTQDGYYAINPDGTEKWHFDTDGLILQTAALAADGTVYLSSHDDHMYSHGWLYALNSTDGSLLWQYDLHNRPGSPAVGNDDTIYIPSCDDYLYAFNPDGSLKWKTEIGVGSINSPTIAADGTIYVGESEFYAINPDGTRKWVYDPGEDWFIDTNAAIASEGTIYFGADEIWGKGADAFALKSDGTLRWRHRMGNGFMHVSPAIAPDGTVYAGCTHNEDGELYGFFYAFGELDPDAPEPPTIDGPTRGKVGETHDYTFTTTSPLSRDVYYYVEWGDGKKTDWTGPYNSGEPVTLNHTWDQRGDYTIKARAKDTENLWGDWGELDIRMPISHNLDVFPLLRILSEILNRYPNLFPFLRILGGLLG